MSDQSSQTFAWQQPGGRFASGLVTGPNGPPPSPPPEPPEPPPSDGPQRRRRQMLIFAGIAGAILAIGLTIILVVALSSDGAPFRDKASAPADLRPPLAQACPPPSGAPSAAPAAPSPPPATEKRTVDQEAGISYKAYGAPWVPWVDVWRAGTLEVPYKVGQHFITEQYSGGNYHASILSAAVPATDNDSLTLDLECVGRQVSADVRAEYYPQPNTMDPLRDELTTLGGRPAWVSSFRLHFNAPGLTATEELSAVAVIDVGKSTAAVLYVSVPGTHKQWNRVVDEVLESVRPV